jgi:predicted N-formylglutamate amidohydrolase
VPTDSFLITCEHGGNRIPAPYRRLFRGLRVLLDSHRGYDPGALEMAESLAAAFAAPMVAGTASRLLVDLNRSVGHRQIFSAATRAAPPQLRALIVDQFYRPYRAQVERLVAQAVTPELYGKLRRADVGLLYDPRRPGEAALCAAWKTALAGLAPLLRVRRNYPYAGKGDGLTSSLRRQFPERAYLGIELEINQALVRAPGRRFGALRGLLVDGLRIATGAGPLASRRARPVAPRPLTSRRAAPGSVESMMIIRRAPGGAHFPRAFRGAP